MPNEFNLNCVNMTDCWGCVDCSGCIGCIECRDCNVCTDCVECISCDSCTGASYLWNGDVYSIGVLELVGVATVSPTVDPTPSGGGFNEVIYREVC
jgi:hypothetical protein